MSEATAVLDDLGSVLQRFHATSLIGMTGAAKAEAMAAITRLRAGFDAAEAAVVGSFEATGEHRAEGHGSAVDWVKHHCGGKGTSTVRARRLAGWLRDVPGLAGPLATGSITPEHVEVIARAHRLLGEDTFAQLEEGLLGLATSRRFCDFERDVDYWIVRADPDGAGDRERQQRHDRAASSGKGPGGAVRVDATFDALAGQTWQAELDRLCDHLLTQDRADARARLGRRPTAGELARTARQRRVDAMALMAERSAAFADADLGASNFQLVVHADLNLVAKVLERLVEALRALQADDDPDAGLDVDLSDLTYDEGSLHELADGTVITVDTILLAILTGAVRGILYDPRGVPLRLGRGQRLFGAIADAIAARYRRCGHPYGCDRTPPRVQYDHGIEWTDGGFTDVGNGGLECDPHNIWKTNHKHDPPPEAPDLDQRRVGPSGPPSTNPNPAVAADNDDDQRNRPAA